MIPFLHRTPLVAATAVGAVVLLTGCGSPTVTAPRVEGALTPTFTNLYLQQAALLGHDGVTAATMAASTACDRGGPSHPDTGAGSDWICMITWTDDTGAQQVGKFELAVHSNDCYTANGPARLIGATTITDTAGQEVMNPVSAFDGCFDPDGNPGA